MMDLLIAWAPALGIFVTVGTLMEALNKTIGGKVGDEGLKGVWYVWKRTMAIPLGAGLGALSGAMGLSTPLGDGIAYGVLFGVGAGWLAGRAYKWIVDLAEVKAKHKLAKAGPPGEEDTKL